MVEKGGGTREMKKIVNANRDFAIRSNFPFLLVFFVFRNNNRNYWGQDMYIKKWEIFLSFNCALLLNVINSSLPIK